MAKLSIEERFRSGYAVDPVTGCWNWQRHITPQGYGQFGRNILAHRVSFEIFKGEMSPKLVVDHLCRNRRCVNPDHLDLVTQQLNAHRGDIINRKKSHCPKGHPYAGANLYVYPDGRRGCEICRQGARERNAAKAAASRQAMRERTHCPRGHEYTTENTRVTMRGSRICITCNNAAVRQQYAKAKKARA